jgi:hypothetical protein
MHHFHLFRIFTFAVLLSTVCPHLLGATVSGTVTGPNGPVASATVIADGGGDNKLRTTTNKDGKYSFNIPNGLYHAFLAEPPGGINGLIGEEVFWVDITGDRKVHLFLAKRVKLSGDIAMPDNFEGELCVHVERLDKSSFSGGWGFDQDNHFEATVAAGVYVIQALSCHPGEYFNSVAIDARKGSVKNIVVPAATPGQSLLSSTPPNAKLIKVGAADDGGIAVISGAPRAIKGPSRIRVVNLQTGHYTTGASGGDGSFTISLFAPPGSYLEVSQDPTGLAWGGPRAAATIIRVPPRGEVATSFATVNRAYEWGGSVEAQGPSESVGLPDTGQVWVSGNVPDRHWMPGENFTLKGKLKIYSNNIPSVDPESLQFYGRVLLERVFDKSGKQELANAEFMSHVLTPTGLPIDRRSSWALGSRDVVSVGDISADNFTVTGARSIGGNWQAAMKIPIDTPDGVYSLVFEPFVEDIQSDVLHFKDVYRQIFDKLFTTGGSILVRVGSPAPGRLSWALGLNDFSNGSRGTVAREDEKRPFGGGSSFELSRVQARQKRLRGVDPPCCAGQIGSLQKGCVISRMGSREARFA